MDWTIPHTFYPTALPDPWVWLLFGMACLGTALGVHQVAKRKGGVSAALLSLPIAAASLFTTMTLGMIVAFFVHDI